METLLVSGCLWKTNSESCDGLLKTRRDELNFIQVVAGIPLQPLGLDHDHDHDRGAAAYRSLAKVIEGGFRALV